MILDSIKQFAILGDSGLRFIEKLRDGFGRLTGFAEKKMVLNKRLCKEGLYRGRRGRNPRIDWFSGKEEPNGSNTGPLDLTTIREKWAEIE